MNPVVSFVLYTALATALGGCRSRHTPDGTASASPSTAPAPSGSTPTPLPALNEKWPVPSGPGLLLVPGTGAGPIRFGATVATIERLMELPCDEKDDTVCRYVGRAVEFQLKDGVVAGIHAHRMGRQVGADPTVAYGFFKGGHQAGARLGMHRHVVEKMLGAPLSRQTAASGARNGLVETHEYDGMRLEYDLLPNENVVLGGISLTGPMKPAGAPSGTR